MRNSSYRTSVKRSPSLWEDRESTTTLFKSRPECKHTPAPPPLPAPSSPMLQLFTLTTKTFNYSCVSGFIDCIGKHYSIFIIETSLIRLQYCFRSIKTELISHNYTYVHTRTQTQSVPSFLPLLLLLLPD